MKYLILLAIALAIPACTSDEVDTFGRTVSAASNAYYNRPAYYPQPVTPVVPVAPVVY